MVATPRTYPQMPEIGHPESYYARLAKHAERHNDEHAHEAAKVGQYVTLAIDPNLAWPQKLRYFKHAINRHCNAPRYAEDACWTFYHNLCDMVREYCGTEALRLASAEDDKYARRLKLGHDLLIIEADAEAFFPTLIDDGTQCPIWYSHDDWEQLKMIRDQWI